MAALLDEIRRVEHTWALDHLHFAAVLADQDARWRSEWLELAGGFAVLWGRGLFVNRALGAGFERAPTVTELALLEERSATVGVPAAVEVGPATHPALVDQLRDRGYVAATTVQAFRLDLAASAAPPEVAGPAIRIDRADGELLAAWQATAVAGWGHTDPEARRASDAVARAAAAVDGDGFVLARATDDGRPLGCASVTVRSGIATLGGMSTRPEERRRGVQSALIRHRLAYARAAGCTHATSTTRPGGASARNLERHGFEAWYTKTTFESARR